MAVFSTGDELQPPGTTLAFGNIYDSNRFAVEALLARLPVAVENLGVLADDAQTVAAALTEASATCNLILTSGGVSVGDADLVKSTVEALGTLGFWRLNLKPGKPLAFGQIGKSLFLGLPGNPVSTIVTFLMIAKPAIAQLCGMRPAKPVAVRAELTEPIAHKPGRQEFMRGIATYTQGRVRARTTGDQGSNRMSHLHRSQLPDQNCKEPRQPGAGRPRPTCYLSKGSFRPGNLYQPCRSVNMSQDSSRGSAPCGSYPMSRRMRSG